MDISIGQTNENKQPVHSEFAIVRESITITLTLAETQGQAEEWGSFIVDKSKGFECTMIEVAGIGRL